MMKRKSSNSRVLKKLSDPSPTMDYTALVSAIEQTHQTAQHHAAQAVNVMLRN